MITLNSALITTTVQSMNGATATTVTDTLFVSYVEINFNPAGIRAKIQRGTVVSGVFTSNMSDVWVTVNPDGSFTSTDGSFQGAAGALNVTALSAGLATAFDSAILASGAVSGAVA